MSKLFDVTVVKLVSPAATLNRAPGSQVRKSVAVRLQRDDKFGNPLLHVGNAVFKVDDNVRKFFDKFLDQGKLGLELRQPPVHVLIAPPTPKKTKKRSAADGNSSVITVEEEEVPVTTVARRLRSLRRKLKLLSEDPYRVDIAVEISDDERDLNDSELGALATPQSSRKAADADAGGNEPAPKRRLKSKSSAAAAEPTPHLATPSSSSATVSKISSIGGKSEFDSVGSSLNTPLPTRPTTGK